MNTKPNIMNPKGLIPSSHSRFKTRALLVATGIGLAAFVFCVPLRAADSTPPAVNGTYLYAMDFAPHAESAAAIAARERLFEEAWKAFFARLDVLVKNPVRKELDAFIKSRPTRDLLLLANEYGYATLREPGLAKARADYIKQIALAEKVLAKQGITDIGDVANLNSAMREAVLLKEAGRFTPELSRPLEALLVKYVEGKSVFWGFTRKFPYFLSGYNKEAITMEVGSNTKLLYRGMGKFPKTMDAFDAAWAQLTMNGYELDNSPHYDASVNMYIIMRWAMLHGRTDDIRKSPHFRMIFERMARMIMANGECANYGKSMAGLRKCTENGLAYDDFRVNGSMGVGAFLRWGYRFYGDPNFLYLARKYEMMNADGKAPVTLMPKVFDLNFFNVKGAAWRQDAPLSYTTIRLKGPGWSLDRGVRRENIQPVQDKLILSTGSHPRSPTMLMEMSFTQSKVKANRRMGLDNLVFNGAHTVSVVGRPDEAERTNRIIIAPDDRPYPGLGKAAPEKADDGAEDENDQDDKPAAPEKTVYQMADYFTTRVNANLAYGEVEYAQLQYAGVHARRRMALLNNGVMVVEDNVWTDGSYTGRKNAGALYNVWSQVVAKGSNWVITTPKKAHFPDGVTGGMTSALVYFAPAPELKTGLLGGKVFHSSAPLAKGGRVRIVSAIIPMPHGSVAAHGAIVGDGIKTVTDADGGTTVHIPYGPGLTLAVKFPSGAGSLADYQIEGPGAPAKPAPLRPLNAKVNPPYSVAFGKTTEFYVPDFKADFEMNENHFRSVWSGGKELLRGRDYQTMGNILTLTPAFAKSLTDARAKTDLTVRFSGGADVALRLNGDTTPCIRLYNARRSKAYTADEMAMPYGYQDNNRVKAFGGDYAVTFYDDWLYRGKATELVVKDGQTVKLPSAKFRSFRVKRLAEQDIPRVSATSIFLSRSDFWSGLDRAFTRPGLTGRNTACQAAAVQITEHQPFTNAYAEDGRSGEHNFARDFHIYGFEWSERELIFYLDGKELRREKNDFCFSPASVWLSVAIIPWSSRITDAIDGTAREVDYVRGYRKKS